MLTMKSWKSSVCKSTLVAFCLLLAWANITRASKTSDSMTTLRKRVIAQDLERSYTWESLKKSLQTLAADGHWPDIDYHSRQRGGWPTLKHLKRVCQLAAAWRAGHLTPQKQREVLTAALKSLRYWLAKDFQSTNWWNNRIAVPRYVATAVLILQNKLTQKDLHKALEIIKRAKIGMTGQNRVWLAQNVLLDGLITGKRSQVELAARTIFTRLKTSRQEGIQPDFSFQQHGPQLQFGNYGLAFVSTESDWFGLTWNTPFQPSAAQQKILSRYMRSGLRWILWRNQMDISALGRQIWPYAQTSKARSLVEDFKKMISLDPAHALSYQQAIEEAKHPDQPNQLIGDRAFYCSDFYVHRRPDSYVSVKMCSSRVRGTETVNGENLLGAHFGDGAMYVYRSGKEYENIFPVWDWHRVPGTTSFTHHKIPHFGIHGLPNPNDFVGEVTDGQSGAAAMVFQRNHLSARKAYFFFDHATVCLGSGIHVDSRNSTGDNDVSTTINQCLLNGPVRYAAPGKEIKTLDTPSPQSLPGGSWVVHDHIAYLILSPHGAVTAGTQTGNWHRVFQTKSTTPVEKKVFTLSIDQGNNPQDARYAYVVMPNANEAAAQADVANWQSAIIENSTRLQAVRHDDLTAAVFYQPGKVKIASVGEISVNVPCLLLVRHDAKHNVLHLTLSDPTQKLKTATIKLSGQWKTGHPASPTHTAHSQFHVDFPQGLHAGASVTINLEPAGS